MVRSPEWREKQRQAALRYWEDVRAGRKPKPPRPGYKYTAKMRREYSKRAKAQWEALSPEAKEAEKARLNTINACSWDDKKRKEVHAKIAATNRKAENRLKMSKALKKACARPEVSQHKSEARKKWCASPEGKAWFAELSKRFKGRKKPGTVERQSEINWAIETGITEEAQRQYEQERDKYYNMAKRALEGTGVEPDRGQLINYYKDIIAYFEPEWLDEN